MKKALIGVFITIVAICSILIWLNYPRSIYYFNSLIYSDLDIDTVNIPLKNKSLLKFAEINGSSIAPTYEKAVCTEYLIQVLQNFCGVTPEIKKKIRIITKEDLNTMLSQDSVVTKGVYHALTSTGLGIPVDNPAEAKAGDLIQFWDYDSGEPYGHCGIIRAVDLEKGLISLYSSARSTNGHDKQIYVLPKYMFIVRLK